MAQASATPAAKASAAKADTAQAVSEVVVTGTRLTTGFNSPTPTQVLSVQQLQRTAAPNLYDAVQQLPALMGSRGTSVGNGGTSEGVNGLSVLSMRGLGPIRTLTLVDGLRVAPANINGTVDVSLIPQLLIERVDVVSGGASASYGSDAVGGVVNFIMNNRFTGFKANVQGGTTNYWDDKSILAQAAWGGTFADDRLHVIASGEYYNNGGIPSRDPGVNGGPNGRHWFQLPIVATRSPAQTPAGQPQYELFLNGQFNRFAAYGLITSGPLKGTAFGPGGAPYQFQYGTNCIGGYCEGGENTGNVFLTSSLDSELRRGTIFTRVGYDLTPDAQMYANFSYAEVRTQNQTNAGARQEGNLTIQCDNAFLPQSIKSACAADGITSFGFGVSNIIFPGDVHVETHRKQPRFVVGLDDSNLSLFGKRWHVQLAYEHGETDVAIDIHNVMLNPRYRAAIDAIQLPDGSIACRNTVARDSGCVPFNIIGLNPVEPAAWAYIAPSQGPRVRSTLKEDFATAAFSGAPFRNWAGDVSVAFGAEWRKESYVSTADWYGAGISAQSPVNAMFPADPILVPTGNNWYAGSFKNGEGSYSVKEAFAEVGMPLFDTDSLGKLNLDLAGRITDYSTSGQVSTWKVGSTWDTPIDGLRFRGVVSRDVRAPNLSELFPATISQNATVVDRTTNSPVNVDQRIIGNPSLQPEKADNYEVGAVYQPHWLPGLSASIDYYNIKLNGAISSLNGQQVVDLCQISGNQQACSLIKLTGAVGTSDPPFVILQPLNLASIKTDGLDIAIGYRMGLDRWSLPGEVSILAQATHVFNFVEDTGIPGQPVIYAAGNNSNFGGVGYSSGDFGVTPEWKGLITESWETEKGGVELTERFVSSGYINPSWVQCTPGSCPLPTVQHPTIDHNNLPGAVYLDIGGHYQFTRTVEGYFKIDNLFDHDPPPYGAPQVYDWFGRIYRVGFRLKM